MIKNFFQNIKTVYKYSYGCRKYIIIYLFFSFLMMLVGLLFPIITSWQLVSLTNELWKQLIIFTLLDFGLSFFDISLNHISMLASQKFSKKVISKIQIGLGKEILKLELKDIDRSSTGVFIQRLTSDVNEMASIFTYGVNLINYLISDVGTIIIIFFINFWVGLFYLGYVIISLFLEKIKIKKINKKDKDLRNQKEETSGFATELIRGIRDIKMLNAEKSFVRKVENKIDNLNDSIYSIRNMHNFFGFIKSTLNQLFNLCLVFLIIYFVKNNVFEVAIGIVIYNYKSAALSIVHIFDNVLEYIRNFNMSCERVFDLFGSKEFKKETFGSIHLDKINGDFEFSNVDFGYNETKILKDLSFKVNANEMVAFVGKSGSGKSTIFNLICKFYEVDSGSIKIDGIDIKELDKDTIRGNITIINQNPYIFNMSIRENLKLVKSDLTDEEMKEACRMACLDEFIESLPDGYDTLVGEAGINLSGGQRQRLAIARALVQKTEIILFDEATSALDNETQEKIQKAIENMQGEYTILIIAHRLSTIKNANRILYLEDGKIKASGTHLELLKNCREYKKLYENEEIK